MSQLQLKRVTQTFKDQDVEARYQSYRRERHQMLVRFSLLLGIFLFAIYVYLDCAILGGTWSYPAECVEPGGALLSDWVRMRNIRVAMVGVLGLTLLATWIRSIWRFDRLILFTGLALSGAAIILVAVLASDVNDVGLEHYYVGLCLVVLFAAFLFRIPAFATTLLALVMFAGYDAVAFSEIPDHVFLNNNFFMGAVLLTAIVGSRATAQNERRVYWETYPIAARPKVFVSYAHADREWLDRLMTQLRPNLMGGRDGDVWTDERLQSGDRWRREIGEALETAHSAVLLVSRKYLASDFIHTHELMPILQAEDVQIHWICLNKCRWKESGLREIQSVGDPHTPLTSMEEEDQEAVLIDLADRIAEDLEREKQRTR